MDNIQLKRVLGDVCRYFVIHPYAWHTQQIKNIWCSYYSSWNSTRVKEAITTVCSHFVHSSDFSHVEWNICAALWTRMQHLSDCVGSLDYNGATIYYWKRIPETCLHNAILNLHAQVKLDGDGFGGSNLIDSSRHEQPFLFFRNTTIFTTPPKIRSDVRVRMVLPAILCYH